MTEVETAISIAEAAKRFRVRLAERVAASGMSDKTLSELCRGKIGPTQISALRRKHTMGDASCDRLAKVLAAKGY